MRLTGLHVLLTYQCNFECDHCFVWSGPRQTGTLTIPQLDGILLQAKEAETIEWIWFEGGEAFLFYAPLRHGARRARELGFRVGVVSNAYWATDRESALAWLGDLADSVEELAVSCDRFHGNADQVRRAAHAMDAARELGISCGAITIESEEDPVVGQLPEAESGVMYRGRAAVKLAPHAPRRSVGRMTACPYEDLREPGRLHVDPFGNLHICQGIVIGNLFRMPLREICASWDPVAHPVTGPLLAGGPAELARRYGIQPVDGYADACHLCYETRLALRPAFPDALGPGQMYGHAAS